MALKALLPIGIMIGAIGTMGTFTGEAGRKRQYVEQSLSWELALRREGIVPPRTHVNPFIAKPHPMLEGREIPLRTSGALLSQIVPGGPLDPYANPGKVTKEALEKERKRLDALMPETAKKRAEYRKRMEEAAASLPKDARGRVDPQAAALARVPPSRGLWDQVGRIFLEESDKPVHWVDLIEESRRVKHQEALDIDRHAYRTDSMAEPARILAYARLHPELQLDVEKFNKAFNLKELRHQY